MDPCHRRRPRLEFIRSSAAALAQTVDDLHTRPVEPPVDVALLGGPVIRVATKDKLQVLLSPFSRPGPALPISACIRGVAGLSCARPRAVTGATASQSIHFLELIIQARARNRRHARLLMDRGVEWLVRESYFSSLVRAEHALTALGIEASRLADNIAVVRAWCEENVARVPVRSCAGKRPSILVEQQQAGRCLISSCTMCAALGCCGDRGCLESRSEDVPHHHGRVTDARHSRCADRRHGGPRARRR